MSNACPHSRALTSVAALSGTATPIRYLPSLPKLCARWPACVLELEQLWAPGGRRFSGCAHSPDTSPPRSPPFRAPHPGTCRGSLRPLLGLRHCCTFRMALPQCCTFRAAAGATGAGAEVTSEVPLAPRPKPPLRRPCQQNSDRHAHHTAPAPSTRHPNTQRTQPNTPRAPPL